MDCVSNLKMATQADQNKNMSSSKFGNNNEEHQRNKFRRRLFLKKAPQNEPISVLSSNKSKKTDKNKRVRILSNESLITGNETTARSPKKTKIIVKEEQGDITNNQIITDAPSNKVLSRDCEKSSRVFEFMKSFFSPKPETITRKPNILIATNQNIDNEHTCIQNSHTKVNSEAASSNQNRMNKSSPKANNVQEATTKTIISSKVRTTHLPRSKSTSSVRNGLAHPENKGNRHDKNHVKQLPLPKAQPLCEHIRKTDGSPCRSSSDEGIIDTRRRTRSCIRSNNQDSYINSKRLSVNKQSKLGDSQATEENEDGLQLTNGRGRTVSRWKQSRKTLKDNKVPTLLDREYNNESRSMDRSKYTANRDRNVLKEKDTNSVNKINGQQEMKMNLGKENVPTEKETPLLVSEEATETNRTNVNSLFKDDTLLSKTDMNKSTFHIYKSRKGNCNGPSNKENISHETIDTKKVKEPEDTKCCSITKPIIPNKLNESNNKSQKKTEIEKTNNLSTNKAILSNKASTDSYNFQKRSEPDRTNPPSTTKITFQDENLLKKQADIGQETDNNNKLTKTTKYLDAWPKATMSSKKMVRQSVKQKNTQQIEDETSKESEINTSSPKTNKKPPDIDTTHKRKGTIIQQIEKSTCPELEKKKSSSTIKQKPPEIYTMSKRNSKIRQQSETSTCQELEKNTSSPKTRQKSPNIYNMSNRTKTQLENAYKRTVETVHQDPTPGETINQHKDHMLSKIKPKPQSINSPVRQSASPSKTCNRKPMKCTTPSPPKTDRSQSKLCNAASAEYDKDVKLDELLPNISNSVPDIMACGNPKIRNSRIQISESNTKQYNGQQIPIHGFKVSKMSSPTEPDKQASLKQENSRIKISESNTKQHNGKQIPINSFKVRNISSPTVPNKQASFKQETEPNSKSMKSSKRDMDQRIKQSNSSNQLSKAGNQTAIPTKHQPTSIKGNDCIMNSINSMNKDEAHVIQTFIKKSNEKQCKWTTKTRNELYSPFSKKSKFLQKYAPTILFPHNEQTQSPKNVDYTKGFWKTRREEENNTSEDEYDFSSLASDSRLESEKSKPRSKKQDMQQNEEKQCPICPDDEEQQCPICPGDNDILDVSSDSSLTPEMFNEFLDIDDDDICDNSQKSLESENTNIGGLKDYFTYDENGDPKKELYGIRKILKKNWNRAKDKIGNPFNSKASEVDITVSNTSLSERVKDKTVELIEHSYIKPYLTYDENGHPMKEAFGFRTGVKRNWERAKDQIKRHLSADTSQSPGTVECLNSDLSTDLPGSDQPNDKNRSEIVTNAPKLMGYVKQEMTNIEIEPAVVKEPFDIDDISEKEINSPKAKGYFDQIRARIGCAPAALKDYFTYDQNGNPKKEVFGLRRNLNNLRPGFTTLKSSPAKPQPTSIFESNHLCLAPSNNSLQISSNDDVDNTDISLQRDNGNIDDITHITSNRETNLNSSLADEVYDEYCEDSDIHYAEIDITHDAGDKKENESSNFKKQNTRNQQSPSTDLPFTNENEPVLDAPDALPATEHEYKPMDSEYNVCESADSELVFLQLPSSNISVQNSIENNHQDDDKDTTGQYHETGISQIEQRDTPTYSEKMYNAFFRGFKDGIEHSNMTRSPTPQQTSQQCRDDGTTSRFKDGLEYSNRTIPSEPQESDQTSRMDVRHFYEDTSQKYQDDTSTYRFSAPQELDLPPSNNVGHFYENTTQMCKDDISTYRFSAAQEFDPPSSNNVGHFYENATQKYQDDTSTYRFSAPQEFDPQTSDNIGHFYESTTQMCKDDTSKYSEEEEDDEYSSPDVSDNEFCETELDHKTYANHAEPNVTFQGTLGALYKDSSVFGLLKTLYDKNKKDCSKPDPAEDNTFSTETYRKLILGTGDSRDNRIEKLGENVEYNNSVGSDTQHSSTCGPPTSPNINQAFIDTRRIKPQNRSWMTSLMSTFEDGHDPIVAEELSYSAGSDNEDSSSDGGEGHHESGTGLSTGIDNQMSEEMIRLGTETKHKEEEQSNKSTHIDISECSGFTSPSDCSVESKSEIFDNGLSDTAAEIQSITSLNDQSDSPVERGKGFSGYGCCEHESKRENYENNSARSDDSDELNKYCGGTSTPPCAFDLNSDLTDELIESSSAIEPLFSYLV